MTTFANVCIFLFGIAANVIGFSPAYWFECFRFGNDTVILLESFEVPAVKALIFLFTLPTTVLLLMALYFGVGLKFPLTKRPIIEAINFNSLTILCLQIFGIIFQYCAFGKIERSLDFTNLVCGMLLFFGISLGFIAAIPIARIVLIFGRALQADLVSTNTTKQK